MNDGDLRLAKRLLAGEDAAFREFFADYFQRVYRFALRRVGGDVDCARDVAQSTLIKSVRALDSYRGEASLFTWICQIARREVFDVSFRQGEVVQRSIRFDDNAEVRAMLESLESDVDWHPEAALQHAQTAEAIHTVLDSLPQTYASVLELKYLEGLTVEAIGVRLGRSPIAVQSMLARARAAFQEGLNSIAGGAEALGALGPTAR